MAQLLTTEVRDGMRIDWDVAIPARDGLVLKADVFRPNKPGLMGLISLILSAGVGWRKNRVTKRLLAKAVDFPTNNKNRRISC